MMLLRVKILKKRLWIWSLQLLCLKSSNKLRLLLSVPLRAPFVPFASFATHCPTVVGTRRW